MDLASGFMDKIHLLVIRLSSGAYVYEASEIGEKAHEEHLSGYPAPGVSGTSMISQSRFYPHSLGSEHTVCLHFFLKSTSNFCLTEGSSHLRLS